jgi:hypothetical protein
MTSGGPIPYIMNMRQRQRGQRYVCHDRVMVDQDVVYCPNANRSKSLYVII